MKSYRSVQFHSGMDTKSAKEYFEILKKLTLEGRTVVCSIRHPNTSLLNFFNNAYFLYEGRCIYQGTVHNLIPYLFANNFECPLHNDSVEYVMEICSTDKSNHAENLSAAITNGKSQEWLDCPTCWSTIPLNTLNIRHIQRNEIEDSFQYTRSFKHQLYFLLKMISLTLARNRLLTRTIFITNVCIALFFAMFFNGIGNNAALVRINYNLLFLCLAEVMYINLISKIITFYIEMPVIKKEYLSGWYSLKAYFVASALIDVPTQTFFVIIFSSIVYYFTDQSLEIYRFTQFVIIMVLFGLLFQDYGMCVATFINTKFQNAILFAIYSTFPWMIFCGIFINYQDTSFLFKWFFKMSVFHRALEAVTTVTYGYNRKSLICFKSFCYFKNPHTFVKKLDMDCDSFIFDFVYLLVVYVIIKFCCYSALKYKILHPK